MVLSSIDKILNVLHLSFAYDDRLIFTDLSFSLERGKILAVLGHSGSGKSTLLKLILGNLQPTTGLIESVPPVVLVPQDKALLPWLNCVDNVATPLRALSSLSKKDAKVIARSLLDEFGLKNIEKQYPESLSGGQYVKVQLARSLALEPNLLLLDEVTNSLDHSSILDVIRQIHRFRERNSNNPSAIILVTHDVGFARALAEQFFLIHSPSRHELVSDLSAYPVFK